MREASPWNASVTSTERAMISSIAFCVWSCSISPSVSWCVDSCARMRCGQRAEPLRRQRGEDQHHRPGRDDLDDDDRPCAGCLPPRSRPAAWITPNRPTSPQITQTGARWSRDIIDLGDGSLYAAATGRSGRSNQYGRRCRPAPGPDASAASTLYTPRAPFPYPLRCRRSGRPARPSPGGRADASSACR